MSAIFLLGFMGSGKSAIARALSREVQLPLIDLDARIEDEIGTSIANFFSSKGEEAFRAVETEILRSVCGEKAVISLGGGVPTRQENRILLQNAGKNGDLVTYLQTSPAVLAQRIRKQPGKRPLIDGDGMLDLTATQRRVEELLDQREPFYRECANFCLTTDIHSISTLARQIATRYYERERQSWPIG